MGLEPIIIETEVDAPLDRAWRAWTEPDQLATWLTEQANIRAEVTGPYELFWEPDHPERNSTLGCTIIMIEPNERLMFTWKGPVDYADLMNEPPLPTSVIVTFRAVSQHRTLVRLEHFGWGSGSRWMEARTWHERVWQNALVKMREHVEM